MRPLRLALAGLISIAVVAGVVLYLWTAGSSSATRKPFSTLSVAPRDANFYMAFNTDPASAQWITLSKRLAAVKSDKPIRDGLGQLLEKSGLSWDKDVVSVLGDEAFVAITDYAKLGDQKGVVAALRLRDAKKAHDNFLKVARASAQDSGQALLEEKYQGVAITFAQEDVGSGRNRTKRDSGAMAFPGDLAVIGLSRDDVKGVIDVIQGRAPNLTENSRFQELRARQKDDFLVWGYADLAAAWGQIEDSAGRLVGASTETQSALKEARDSADRMTFAFSAQAPGLVLDAQIVRATGVAAGASSSFKTQEPSLARQVPADTIFLLAGANAYEQLYSPIHGSAAKDRDAENALKQLETDLGFRLDADLFGFMKGEYGLAGSYSSQDGELSLLGLFNIQDAARVSKSLDFLDSYLSRNTGLTASGPDRNGLRRLGDAGETFAWKTTDKSLVAGYPDTAVQALASPPAGRSLADTPDWKQAMAALPAEKSFVAYVSVARLLDEAEAQGIDTPVPSDAGADFSIDDLRQIRAVAISGSSGAEGQRLRIVLLMNP